jgi:FeS assembly protein IscX
MGFFVAWPGRVLAPRTFRLALGRPSGETTLDQYGGCMKWTDTLDIAIELSEAHPDVDPTRINFVDLMNWTMALPGFDDDKSRCGEKILEAIQMAWIEEVS